MPHGVHSDYTAANDLVSHFILWTVLQVFGSYGIKSVVVLNPWGVLDVLFPPRIQDNHGFVSR